MGNGGGLSTKLYHSLPPNIHRGFRFLPLPPIFFVTCWKMFAEWAVAMKILLGNVISENPSQKLSFVKVIFEKRIVFTELGRERVNSKGKPNQSQGISLTLWISFLLLSFPWLPRKDLFSHCHACPPDFSWFEKRAAKPSFSPILQLKLCFCVSVSVKAFVGWKKREKWKEENFPFTLLFCALLLCFA